MSNQRVAIEIKQGAGWAASVRVKRGGVVRDLTGAAVYMQIREKAGAPVIADLNTTNGKIVIDVNNYIKIALTAAETKTYTFSKAEFDLFIDPVDGEPEKIMEGSVSLIKSITVF